ncbi:MULTISPECIES: DNA helicase [Bosea]|uniref:DNA helicase n=1 Tax=Bosea TaxID=85413 RepID=UPI0021501C80|nr:MULTISPECIES: DNA helicase [Bosea]MCR4523654.1 DNA helicase [Bosea sp. 47.2.35]MDR6826937.1 replicative DNA helicase [Bosea robiniae]MDR6893647.1 replicative DNA helicase [Bosea sp. BE109]MDR7136654.1 replicative DNA helicase [Bosea sp. BE168]MDR7173353.1 replicative DNA helicase [Bosea sp. BE271]
MNLSAPIHQLKRKARLMSRAERIPLHAALDRIAIEEGYRSWSLLSAKQPGMTSIRALWPLLVPGDLVLIAGRPGQGKTLAGLALLAEAMRVGHRGVFLTLEYALADVFSRLQAINIEPGEFAGLFDCDCSDAISADYIVARLAEAPRGTVAVIDYLQLLDQRRDTPELALQVRALKAFARERGLILVFLSQVDRSYEGAGKPFPEIADVRLPNPLDLSLFDKTCFVNRGETRFRAAA